MAKNSSPLASKVSMSAFLKRCSSGVISVVRGAGVVAAVSQAGGRAMSGCLIRAAPVRSTATVKPRPTSRAGAWFRQAAGAGAPSGAWDARTRRLPLLRARVSRIALLRSDASVPALSSLRLLLLASER